MPSKKVRESLKFEAELWKEYPLIAGVDEAGRGSLAGPLVVAAVILPPNFSDSLIQDSKKLTPAQRNIAYSLIKQWAISYQITLVSVEEIEKQNPSAATKEAMKTSLENLSPAPQLCLVDGREKIILENTPALSIIGGDSLSINIAAASILAKVTRDELMSELHLLYPSFGWNKNKGYADKKHLSVIINEGFCSLHRRNYDPVKTLLKKNNQALQELKKRYGV